MLQTPAPRMLQPSIAGDKQRRALHEQAATARLILTILSVAGAIGLTALAQRHTEAVNSAAKASSAHPAISSPNAPSQSLFQSGTAGSNNFVSAASAFAGSSRIRSSMS
jgi:hypothetical protein